MKLGIFLGNDKFSNLDYSNPSYNNPGISGTIFQKLILIEKLPEYNENIKIIQFSTTASKLDSYKNIVVKDEYEAVSLLTSEHIDIYITDNIELINHIKSTGLKVVFWINNYLFFDKLNKIHSLKENYRIVFSGKQFYDRYIDHEAIMNSDFIYNMVPNFKFDYKPITDESFNVTFIGAIIPSKGFHYLAKAWKRILVAIPNARLYVIGNGALYSSDIKLGKYSLAEEPYETYIIDLLKKADTNLSSITFCGILDEKRKREIIQKTQVGVMNPSARTETFGLSSTDFQQQNVPVVIRMKNGLLDTFLPGRTGLGFYNPLMLYKPIIRLYKDKNLRSMLSLNGADFINEKFAINESFSKWVRMLDDFIDDKKPNYNKPNNYFFNNIKFLRILNRILRINLKMGFVPSIIEVESKIYNFIKKCKGISRI